MEVSPSHSKMRLNGAPPKMNFLMAKVIQKSYTLNCSHKCPSTFPHSYALLRHLISRKTILFETNKIFYSLGNQNCDKTNNWSEKYIKNKYAVTLKFFKFCLCQQSFAFKRFCMETRLSNTLLRSYNFWKPQIVLWKHAKNHIYGEMAL